MADPLERYFHGCYKTAQGHSIDATVMHCCVENNPLLFRHRPLPMAAPAPIKVAEIKSVHLQSYLNRVFLAPDRSFEERRMPRLATALLETSADATGSCLLWSSTRVLSRHNWVIVGQQKTGRVAGTHSSRRRSVRDGLKPPNFTAREHVSQLRLFGQAASRSLSAKYRLHTYRAAIGFVLLPC